MKKFLLIFSLIALIVSAQAQEESDYDAKIDYSESWRTFLPSTNATTATDSIWYYTILRESVRPVKYKIKIDIDSVSGTAVNVPVVLQRKTFKLDSYTNMDTVTWTGAADTSIIFTNIATTAYLGTFAADSTTVTTVTSNEGYIDRYFRLYIKTANKGFVIKVTELSAKFTE